MRNPSTFESRLVDAFEQLASDAPLEVDSRALAAGVARRPQVRRSRWLVIPRPETPTSRLVLIAAVLALIALVGLAISGAFRLTTPPFTSDNAPTPPVTSSIIPSADGTRILVWLPVSDTQGTATLLNADGTVVARATMSTRGGGCPILIGGTDTLAIRGFGEMTVQAIEGQSPAGVPLLDTNYAGFERFSTDHRTVALVDMENGSITVARLDPVSGWTGSTHYGPDARLAGAVDAAFSEDGRRLLVAVEPGNGELDLHVLEDGTDRLAASLPRAAATQLRLALSPHGRRLAVWQGVLEQPSPEVVTSGDTVIVTLDDGTVSEPIPTPAPLPSSVQFRPDLAPFVPLSWSPDDQVLAVRLPSSLAYYDATTRGWTNTGEYFHGTITSTAWSGTPADRALALIDAEGHFHVEGNRDIADKSSVIFFPGKGAFSPDGSKIVTVVSNGSPSGSNGTADVSLLGVWGAIDPSQIASLPFNPDMSREEAVQRLCVDWQLGGAR